jgi:hypothetical protein
MSVRKVQTTSPGVSSQGLKSSSFELGYIESVDTDRWTATVVLYTKMRRIQNCFISSPYSHRASGEGAHFMPEPGADVIVCLPSDNTRPFIMCYVPLPGEGLSGDGRRPRLTLGSYAILTRDGNGLEIDRGGRVAVRANSVCATTYLSADSSVTTFADRVRVNTPVLDFQVDPGDADELPFGLQSGEASLGFRYSPGDEHYGVELNLKGGLIGGSALQLDVYRRALPGGPAPQKSATVSITADGTITLESRNEIGISTATVTITGEGIITIRGVAVNVESSGSMSLSAPEIELKGSSVGPSFRAVLGELFRAEFALHTHPVTGSVTGVPTDPLPDYVFSDSVRFGA